MRRRWNKNTVGRTRERLAKLLQDAGYEVAPEQLKAVQGRYRSDPKADIFRWEAFFDHDGIPANMVSWETMTDIVRSGGVVVKNDDGTLYASSSEVSTCESD